MKRIAFLLATTVSVLLLGVRLEAKPIPKSLLEQSKDDTAKKEVEKKMEGVWHGVAAVANGGKGSFVTVWSIKGGTITSNSSQKEENVSTWKYRVISAGPPVQINLMPNSGVGANKTLPGIIKVDQDTLVVCYTSGRLEKPEEFRRPTQFEVLAEKDYVTLTFRREGRELGK